MKKSIVLFLLTTLFLVHSNAQEVTSVPESKFAHPNSEIGFAAGFVSGYGLSYRYWPNKIGFQLTAFPLISNTESYISAGALGLIELESSSWFRFFAFIGGNMNKQKYEETNYYTKFDLNGYLVPAAPTQVNKTIYAGGFGPGIEFTPGNRIGLNLMTGFQFSYTNKNDWGSYPTIEAAIYFRY